MTDYKVCPSCEAPNAAGSSVCYACGMTLEGSGAARQPVPESEPLGISPEPAEIEGEGVPPASNLSGDYGVQVPASTYTPAWTASPYQPYWGWGYTSSPGYAYSYGSPQMPIYGWPPYPYSVPVPIVPRHESLSIWSFVIALLSLPVFLPFCLPLGIIAVVLGAISLRRIGRDESALKGKGFAVAGIVIGALSTLWTVIWIIVLVTNPQILSSS